MDDIVPKDPDSNSRLTRGNTGVEPSSRPLFDPGRVEGNADWKTKESPQLTQEQAERLDETREPGDVKYIMKPISDPEKYLQWRSEVISASHVDYRRIHLGNLEDRLGLHTGEYDVPSGRRAGTVDYDGDSPFEVNLNDFRLRLNKGVEIFQVIYYNWSYDDEEGGPASSSMYSKRVDERPEGWISVSEVSEVKDQTQSAITRAIRHGELTAVMQKSPQKRWVRPDEDLEQWTPGRQTNYLLRRRLKLVKESIYSQLDRPRGTRILSFGEIMDRAKKLETRRFGPAHVPESYFDFFEESLDHCPGSMKEWVKRIGELVGKYCRS